jgi:dihydrofolate synthase/folylpolyglutamate synthase
VAPPTEPRTALLQLEQTGIKLGLEQIRQLVDRLHRPDRAYPSLIVAGTNGKGSVTAMLERGLRRTGRRTGRFTSPHLVDLEERFALDGVPITREVLDAAAGRVLAAARSLPAPPTFFEATTALALDVFREAGVDVAILEVGLGGRLDATNVVEAVAAAITSVDFDHEELLGTTLAAIAREKAGVVKPGTLAVLAANPRAVADVVAAACREAGARLVDATSGTSADVRMVDGYARVDLTTPVRAYEALALSLAGRHQVNNAVCAVRLLEELSVAGRFDVSETAVRSAVEEAEWPARLERVTVAGIDVLLDGAHNPAGARALADHIGETYARRLPMAVGVMRDKQADEIVRALAPAACGFVCTAAATARAAAPEALAAAVVRVAPGVPTLVAPQPLDAVRRARAFGSPVVVAGSLYLAGEVRAHRS